MALILRGNQPRKSTKCALVKKINHLTHNVTFVQVFVVVNHAFNALKQMNTNLLPGNETLAYFDRTFLLKNMVSGNVT